MAERLRLGVIFGGRSLEHEVSVVSAQYVIDAAKDRYDVVPIGVTTSQRRRSNWKWKSRRPHGKVASGGDGAVVSRRLKLSSIGVEEPPRCRCR